MRLLCATIVTALLATGCLGPTEDTLPPTATSPPTNDLTPTPISGTTVYDETLDFSEDTSGGVVHEAELEFPTGVRFFTFTAEFTSDTPTATTKDVRIWIVDGNGDTLADCDLGTNAATTAEARDCGPSTQNVRDTSYTLRWRGFGNLRSHVVVTAE